MTAGKEAKIRPGRVVVRPYWDFDLYCNGGEKSMKVFIRNKTRFVL